MVPCELAVVSIGVVPNADLAREAGLAVGSFGGVTVDEHMRTSDPCIYAAGRTAWRSTTGSPARRPSPRTATWPTWRRAWPRTIWSWAIRGPSPARSTAASARVFDLSAGATGLSEKRARDEGFEVVTATNASLDRPGFMGARLLVSKMVADAKTGRILGFQCVGPGEVNRQLAEAAMAVMNGNTVLDVNTADLPYAPPFSLAIDHFITTAHILDNKMCGRMTGISNAEVKARLDNRETPFILDVRAPGEFETMRLDVGETLIPLGGLRNAQDKLPEDKGAEIITFCKISMRGYEAQRILEAQGWTNVKVMEGGIMALAFQSGYGAPSPDRKPNHRPRRNGTGHARTTPSPEGIEHFPLPDILQERPRRDSGGAFRFEYWRWLLRFESFRKHSG